MTESTTERAITYAALCVFAAIAVLPIVGIAITAFNPPHAAVSGFTVPSSPSFDNLAESWRSGQFAHTLVSSAIVAAGVVVLTTVLSVLAGYAFGVLRFPGCDLLFGVFLVGLVLPAEAVVIPLYYDIQAYAPQLSGSYLALILPESARYLAFGAFWMRAFFRSVPSSLGDAGRMDGANSLQVLVHVLLRPARPAVLTLMVVSFLWSWNEFLLPLVMFSSDPGHQTAPVGLALFTAQRTTDIPGLAAGALIASAPVVLLYVALQRHFIRGVLAGAVKG